MNPYCREVAYLVGKLGSVYSHDRKAVVFRQA